MRAWTTLAVLVLFPTVLEAQIPRQALPYRRSVTQEARLVWGLNAPLATFFAQLHQESGFRADARSPYAGGLAQFTEATAKWIAEVYPDLGEAAPFEPEWAIRAFVRYDKHLFDRVLHATTECDRWAFTLSGYNGGAGNVYKQRKAAALAGKDPNRWFGSVEYFRVRAQWAHDENRNYPRAILLKRQHLYVEGRWGRGVDCRGIV